MAPMSTARKGSEDEVIRFTNIKQNESVSQRLLLIVGRAGTPDQPVRSIVVHPDPRSRFEAIEWQVNQSHFKATVPLREGDNVLRFLPNMGTKDYPHGGNGRDHEVELHLKYEPQDVPPLRIAILLAKDSNVEAQPTATNCDTASAPTMTHRPYPESTPMPPAPNDSSSTQHEDQPAESTEGREKQAADSRPLVDCPPGPIRDKIIAGGIKEIQRRVAVQAYCWQAFYAEQMHRNRFGRRTFRLEEHPILADDKDTLKIEDLLVVHLVRSKRTIAEFHDANNAQQNRNASNSGAMWNWTQEALSEHPTLGKSRAPIAVLTLESHWVPNHRKAPPSNGRQRKGLILAHAALGGWAGSPWESIVEELQAPEDPRAGSISLGVMGSHWLWSAPSSLSQLTAAFLDETKTDEDYVVSDLGEGGTAWETFCVGMGAWLHEAGHALGNPHWPSGIMSRGYNEFSRIFMTTEAYRTRLGKPGEIPITPANDDRNCHLHRAEACRARWHPNFRLPGDEPAPPTLDASDPASVAEFKQWASLPPLVYATPQGALFQAAQGNHIVAIEIDIDETLVRLIEFMGRPAGDQAREGEAPVKEYLLDRKTVQDAVDAHLKLKGSAGGNGRKNVVVTVRAVGTNLGIVEVGDYFRDAFARQVEIFADREGENPGVGHVRGSGIMALRAPGPGREVEVKRGGGKGIYKWKTAFADQIGARPGLKSISIFADWCLRGIRFEYSDDSAQVFGDVSKTDESTDEGPVRRQFAFDPEKDGGIVRVVVRSGWWIDAIQFILESGKSTDLVGNVSGGSLSVLVPPEGKHIVGLYGSFEEWIRSIGICYEAGPGMATFSDTSDGVEPGEADASTVDGSESEAVEVWTDSTCLPPLFFATSKGGQFQAAPSNGLVCIEIEVDSQILKEIVLGDGSAGKGSSEGQEFVTEYLLDEQTVKTVIDTHLSSNADEMEASGMARVGKGRAKPVVCVRASGTNGRTLEVRDFFRDAFPRPVGIFADREGIKPALGDERGPGILAVHAPSFGEELDLRWTTGSQGQKWTVAFASQVGARPALKAIIIFAYSSPCGLRFEYADGTAQAFGDAGSTHEDRVEHRFTFDPETDGGIARVIVRSGCWIDAIQFVLEGGRSTDMVGDLHGGELHVLVPPEGKRIVGLHGSFDGRMCSVGIFYDADPPNAVDISDPESAEAWKRWSKSPPVVYSRPKPVDPRKKLLDDYSRGVFARPAEIFATREGEDHGQEQHHDLGIMALRALCVGFEVTAEDDEQSGAYEWSTALAGQVGARPHLKAIIIFADWCLRGVRLEYDDESAQILGDVSMSDQSTDEERQARRFTFDPKTDGQIARIVVRAGEWIDAIQFVLESGKSTDMIGNLDGGSLRLLVPPQGKRIVGLYGSFDEWMRSLGICYEATPSKGDFPGTGSNEVTVPTMELSESQTVKAGTSTSTRPLIYATSKGAMFQAAPGTSLLLVEIGIDEGLFRTIECTDRQEGHIPVKEFVLDERTVNDLIDEYLRLQTGDNTQDQSETAEDRRKRLVVRARVVASCCCTAELENYFRDALARPTGIFADREGQEPKLGAERGPGILAVRVPSLGHQVDLEESEDSGAHTFTSAFANHVGARPGLKAITIFARSSVRGLRFEYSDDTSQAFGDVRGKKGIEHRFNFDPEKDGVIVRVVLRSGLWIDAIQFVLESGKSTDLVGGLSGGNPGVLVPPKDKSIVGLYGSFEKRIFSLGIFHEDSSLTANTSDADSKAWETWCQIPPAVFGMSKPDSGVDTSRIKVPSDHSLDALVRPIEIFADRENRGPDGGKERDAGILALPAPGAGNEVEEDSTEDPSTYLWINAIANEVGARPGLTAITIYVDDHNPCGLRFEFSDNTAQVFGDVSAINEYMAHDSMEQDSDEDGGSTDDDASVGYYHERSYKRRYAFDPAKDGGIAQVVVRSGGWIDAIQFTLEGGKSTDMVGDPYGGDLHVLVPPEGKRIVGLYGSFDQRLHSFGICYDASVPTLDSSDPESVQAFQQWFNLPPLVQGTPKSIEKLVKHLKFARPIEIFANPHREGPDSEDHPGAGITAVCDSYVGWEVDEDNTETSKAYQWRNAFLNVVGGRPRLAAITIVADGRVHGLRFEYADGSSQEFGVVSRIASNKSTDDNAVEDIIMTDDGEDNMSVEDGPAEGKRLEHRFTFDPEADGGIARVVVRAGVWIDAIQFVLESGKSTDLIGNLDGGRLSELVPPEGKRIVGLHGTSMEMTSTSSPMMCTVGICYDV
ncbi:hypothetical protein CF326_g4390 [Tilletia indica]|nr:hypothetical protein CF326_g4390 [Tilletia indica]